jgi:predicted site-specific integrase-resolvase
VSDIGSGLNYSRKGLQTLLDRAVHGELETVVVAYKDRLCRFRFSFFESLFRRLSSANIVVLNNRVCSPDEELATDILSVVTVFSARINGRKRYTQEKRTKKEKEGTTCCDEGADLSNRGTQGIHSSS